MKLLDEAKHIQCVALVINVVERMTNDTAAIVTHVLGVVVNELLQNYHSLLTVRGSIVTQSYGSLRGCSQSIACRKLGHEKEIPQ